MRPVLYSNETLKPLGHGKNLGYLVRYMQHHQPLRVTITNFPKTGCARLTITFSDTTAKVIFRKAEPCYRWVENRAKLKGIPLFVDQGLQ